MKIGDVEIPCYVLDNGMRVITHRGLQAAIALAVTGSASETAAFIARLGEKGLQCTDLVARVSSPTEFVPKLDRALDGRLKGCGLKCYPEKQAAPAFAGATADRVTQSRDNNNTTTA